MKRIGIVGASGYTGSELVGLLLRHKKVEISAITSQQYAGKKFSSLYPEFRGRMDMELMAPSMGELNCLDLDLVFLATPHKVSMDYVPKIDTKIIDFSGDYRFRDVKVYEKAYGVKHKDPERKAVFGLPELFAKDIKKANVVANPGCYVTACILAGYPLQDFSKYIVYDCLSGYSGAGKKPCYYNEPKHYKENVLPYKLAKHRHKYEIEQFIKPKLSFTPSVINAERGIMCTAHFLLKKNLSEGQIRKKYENFAKGKPFLRVKAEGGMPPELHDVQNTNFCSLGGFEKDENNTAVVVSAIDNLVKGASGQAVQNMNLMLGFKETQGLL